MKKTPIVEPIDCRETVDQLEAALSAAGLPEELARKVSILLCEGSLFKDELYSDGVPEQVRSDHIESLANRMGTAFCRTGRNKHDSLYEFISTRINPLLDAGWIVLSLNVIAPQEVRRREANDCDLGIQSLEELSDVTFGVRPFRDDQQPDLGPLQGRGPLHVRRRELRPEDLVR